MGAKKLIEVALPLEAINKESAREKSIRHGHPSTLHLWWARRPLAAARAVIWSSLVDDPSSHPEQFPTEEAQNAERERLFRILEKLVVWENSNNPDVLDEAKAEIMKSTDGNPPALLDPFAGGGAIPLEAQRLGLEAHAHDLNPVAVMINKAMIEIPPKFAGQPPIHPGKTELDSGTGWKGAAGLAEDVRYYGEWMKQEAFKRIGHLYPKVKDEKGKEYTVIAWIWVRTVKCSNPACRCEMPLLKSVYLSKKAGNEAYIEISTKDGIPQFSVHKGRTKDYGTINRKGGIYPELFSTMLTPKSEELTADPYFRGGKNEAAIYFENGMAKACKTINRLCNDDFPVTIYYAYKQSENTNLGKEIGTSSTGWETMLSAIIKSGFCITGTWPISTEKSGRTREISSNALASSIIIVCRKRPADAPMCTRRDFINALKRELKPALQKLQASNIAPVDLAQSAIGPGMGVYSRYSNVLEADGTPMSVRSALQIINQELDLYFNEQDGELDKESRFCVELYTQCAFNDIKFGEADVLARAKNTSVDKLRADGVLYSEKGVVHLLTREEIPMEVSKDKGIWLLTQQLTHAMETDGVDGAAKIVKEFFTSEPERAKALAYRLFTLAERRGWANEAFAYNSLIVAWPDVQSRAADLSAAWSNAEQTEIWTSGELFSGEG